jgi:hypothetical protein
MKRICVFGRQALSSGRLRIGLCDLLTLLWLNALIIGGTSAYVRSLPTTVTSVRYGFGQTKEVQHDRDAHVIVICLIGTTLVSAVFIGMFFIYSRCKSSEKTCIPGVVGSFICFMLLLLLNAIQGFDYLKQQLLRLDWHYVSSGEWINLQGPYQAVSVWLAALSTLVIVINGARRQRARQQR